MHRYISTYMYGTTHEIHTIQVCVSIQMMGTNTVYPYKSGYKHCISIQMMGTNTLYSYKSGYKHCISIEIVDTNTLYQYKLHSGYKHSGWWSGGRIKPVQFVIRLTCYNLFILETNSHCPLPRRQI